MTDKIKLGRLILVLTVVTAISALVLSFTYQFTNPRIISNRQARQQENVMAVIPEAESFEEVEREGLLIFEGYDDQERLVGVAVSHEDTGFQGPIVVVTGIDVDTMSVSGVRVQEMAETPGLGARIDEEWFLQQFVNQGLDSDFDADDDYDIIAGATISSEVVAAIVQESLEMIAAIYGEGGL